jgi:vacuolar protein sorting-associated protein IST1
LYSREISDKLPDIPPTEDETGKPKASAGGKSHQTEYSKEETEDEFAVLARRFEELKKR